MHLIKQHILSSSPRNLKAPAIIGAVLVLPFMILELVNGGGIHGNFPIPLFGFMWLLPVSFVVILMSIVRSRPAGNRSMPNPVSLLSKVALLILIAWLWVSLVVDQMPCFLGVPNCD